MKDLITLIRRKEFGRAIKLLQKELSKKPDDVYLLTQMANVLWNLGRDKAALSYADKAQLADSNYPLMLFTRGRILWSLEQHSESIKMWDKLLCAELSDIAEQGWGNRWAKSIVNDALFYKADSLHCIYRSKEAKVLMEEHMANRRKGQESDFTIKEAKAFLRTLTYCSGRRQTFADDKKGWASDRQWAIMEKTIAKKRGDVLSLVAYMKKKSREFPHEYYLKILLAENLTGVGKYKEALMYAQKAYDQEPSDMLVAYDYGNALYQNGKYNEAMMVLEDIRQTDVNIIAYGDHGEGMSWAKSLLKNTENVINLCIRKQVCNFAEESADH